MHRSKVAATFTWFEKRAVPIKWVVGPSLALLIVFVAALVYQTGGIKYVYSHSMYLPVLLAGLIFGVRGGAVAGVCGGLMLGPWMPIDTVTGEQQDTFNWLYRTGFFTLVGCLCGLASDSARSYMRHLQWLARSEPRTGLPNRLALLEQLGEPGDNRSFALVQMCLENSSELEAAFGHLVTDAMMSQLADRFARHFPDTVGVYRIATHELSGLMPCADPTVLTAQLRDFSYQTQESFAFQDLSLHGDVRLSWVPVPQLGENAVVSLQQAEAALLYGRQHGLHAARYDEDIDKGIAENIQVLGELGGSLDAGHLEMHYQPKVSAIDGQVTGVEGLLRWRHPRLGVISPDRFLPRAEQSTLIARLTDFALDSVLMQLVAWRRLGLDLTVAVNISAYNLIDSEFVGRVFDLLSKHGVDGHWLELEVTEGAFMHDIRSSVRRLNRLARENVSVAIDDFGTGYSSLKYLYELPASVIKVDQSFVRSLPDDRAGSNIVQMALGLADKLGMSVVAEGVETLAARDCLRQMGCDLLQGYLVSAPMTGRDLVSWYGDLPVAGCWRPQP